MTVRYQVIDVGSPCDNISLRTLVEEAKRNDIEVHDMITGEVHRLLLKEVDNGRQR